MNNILSYSDTQPLLFTQLYFWVFFTIVLTVYSFIYRVKAIRYAYLFVVSLFFYYKTGGYFFSLLVFSTVVDYILGMSIHRTDKIRLKKLFVALSVLINLGVLGYFKYSYLIVDLLNQSFSLLGEHGVASIGQIEVVNVLALWTNSVVGSSFDVSKIVLPVGISFYTFQTISYTVDVYRKKVEPVRNIVDFGFYVSFFPQLVAGPIVRAAEFIPQLYQKYQLTVRQMGHAVFLILNGLIKKMIISDYISINFVDRVFDSPAAYTGLENLLAAYGYSVQIYCDFSGYTDIAIGVALLLGIRLPINFYSPYKAVDIQDFWRRWHISLSTWLRDYLYIPLGGNKKGSVRTYMNLLVTMLLGGLWHGANVRFIVWGGIHGIALALNRIWASIAKRVTGEGFIVQLLFPKKKNAFRRFLGISATFHIVTLAWIFFRTEDMDTARDMFTRIWEFLSEKPNLKLIWQILNSYKFVLLLIFSALFIHWLPVRWKEYYRGLFIRTPIIVKVLIVIMVVFTIYQVKSSELQPFIYFQF